MGAPSIRPTPTQGAVNRTSHCENGQAAGTVLQRPQCKGSFVLRRSLRTQITTKVVALSAVAALVLGAALVTLIVAVTGQRDAARVAFESQRALSLANQLEKSLLSIESGLNRYVTTRESRYLGTVTRELAAYPEATRRLVRL